MPDTGGYLVLNATEGSISVRGGGVFGTPASRTVLANSPTSVVTGNVTLSVDRGPPATMLLTSGSASFNLGVLKGGNHALAANFAAQGNFTSSSAQATLVVNQATPTISWANPAPITYRTQLSGSQLNASASAAGHLDYSPGAGAGLTAGHQALSVTLAPRAPARYTTPTARVY